jgi:putative oxidoreductase
MGNVIIHYEKGWWIGEHGDGEMEYSCVLILAINYYCNFKKKKSITFFNNQ